MNSEKDFQEFYLTWYSRMKIFAREYVISNDDAEDIVQDIFIQLYENHTLLSSTRNLTAYTFTMVKNRCLDHLKRKMTEYNTNEGFYKEQLLTIKIKFDSLEVLDNIFLNEETIQEIIDKALNKLPEQCRVIFIKFRFENKKQKEIAKELNLSVRTVENQIAIAHTKLRQDLKKYIYLLLFFGLH